MAIIVPRARRFFWSCAEWLRNEKAKWLFQDSETRSWLSKFALRGYFGDSIASYTVIMNSPIHHFDTRLSFVMILYTIQSAKLSMEAVLITSHES